MGQVTIPYPAGLEESVQTTPGEVEQQIRLMAALKMFELGKLSSGRAANYSADELETEIRHDLEAAIRLHAA